MWWFFAVCAYACMLPLCEHILAWCMRFIPFCAIVLKTSRYGRVVLKMCRDPSCPISMTSSPIAGTVVCLVSVECVFGQCGVCVWSVWSVCLVSVECVFGQCGVCVWSVWSVCLVSVECVFGQCGVCVWSVWSVCLVSVECVFGQCGVCV